MVSQGGRGGRRTGDPGIGAAGDSLRADRDLMCVLRRQLIDRMQQRAERDHGKHPMEQRVRYILTTGSNWRVVIFRVGLI
jgi:hypothetical protein